MQNQRNYDASPTPSTNNDRRTASAAGLFVRDEFQWTSELRLTVGGRYDLVTGQSGNQPAPGGAVYRLSDQTVWRAQYGSSFGRPRTKATTACPALQSASSTCALRRSDLEAGLEHYLDSRTRLLASAYVLSPQQTDRPGHRNHQRPAQVPTSAGPRARRRTGSRAPVDPAAPRLRGSLDVSTPTAAPAPR